MTEALSEKLNRFRPLERGIMMRVRLYSQWREAYLTSSPYGLPLHIDLPGVSAPELEEEGDDDE